jgi:hypothetical protein
LHNRYAPLADLSDQEEGDHPDTLPQTPVFAPVPVSTPDQQQQLPQLQHVTPLGLLARYIKKWSIEHYQATKHLLRYLQGTSDLCLSYDSESGKQIILGYADATK